MQRMDPIAWQLFCLPGKGQDICVTQTVRTLQILFPALVSSSCVQVSFRSFVVVFPVIGNFVPDKCNLPKRALGE